MGSAPACSTCSSWSAPAAARNSRTLPRPQYEEVLGYLVDCQDNYKDMLVRARCAPHFKRLAYEKDPNSPITKATGYMGGGCLAGTNYARVTPNGELTPCPYMPLSAGNVRENSFVDLWEKSDIFDSFRYPQLKGKCGDCEYIGYLRRLPRAPLCGSWRLAGRRPVVPLHAQGRREDQGRVQCRGSVHRAMGRRGVDTVEPHSLFLRAMVKKGVEQHAQENGIALDDDRADGRTPKETLRQRRTGIQVLRLEV